MSYPGIEPVHPSRFFAFNFFSRLILSARDPRLISAGSCRNLSLLLLLRPSSRGPFLYTLRAAPLSQYMSESDISNLSCLVLTYGEPWLLF